MLAPSLPARLTAVALIAVQAAPLFAEQPVATRITAAPELPATLPWDLAALSLPPDVEWLDDKAPVRSLLYAGEPFKGKATRVFAFHATPASIDADGKDQSRAAGPWPGIVL